MKQNSLYAIVVILLILTSCKSSDPVKPEEITSGYKVGDFAQGGVVFYVDATGAHGLVYPAPELLTTFKALWSPIQASTGTYVLTDSTIGSGQKNTSSIVSKYGSGTYTAKTCEDLVTGGYSDWYLPSIFELSEILRNKNILPGIQNSTFYRSSTLTSRDPYNTGAVTVLSLTLHGVSTPSGGWYWLIWGIDTQTGKLSTDVMLHANGGKNNEASFIPVRSF